MPARLKGLDAAWFTEILRAGEYPQSTVTQAVMEPLAFTGAVADLARFRLEYAPDSASGPASVIAKIRGSDERRVGMDAVMGLYPREARFYAELADHVPLRTPRCYYIGDGSNTPLLLEDLKDLRIGDQVAGLTPADAEKLMDALADLHAAYWGSSQIEADWLASPATGPFAEMIVQLVGSGMETLRERYRGRVEAGILDAVSALAPRWGEVLTRCADGPQTLAHNDCRLDNIFFDHDGTPVFFDWQIVARTRGTQDVGNLLAGSMNSDDLSRHWQTLLRRYHARLCANGVTGYGWDDCLQHYRQNILYPLGAGIALLGHLDIGDNRGLGDAIILRALHHGAELDAFSSI